MGFKWTFVTSGGLRGGAPLRPKIFSISCSFSQNLAKYNMLAPPRRVGAPSYGVSWIRPCPSRDLHTEKEEVLTTWRSDALGNQSSMTITRKSNLITARKGSLGQGNVFAPVCQGVVFCEGAAMKAAI